MKSKKGLGQSDIKKTHKTKNKAEQHAANKQQIWIWLNLINNMEWII